MKQYSTVNATYILYFHDNLLLCLNETLCLYRKLYALEKFWFTKLLLRIAFIYGSQSVIQFRGDNDSLWYPLGLYNSKSTFSSSVALKQNSFRREGRLVGAQLDICWPVTFHCASRGYHSCRTSLLLTVLTDHPLQSTIYYKLSAKIFKFCLFSITRAKSCRSSAK